jgi:multidrug efflux pump subunit AcrA (membrane-fusion protein)
MPAWALIGLTLIAGTAIVVLAVLLANARDDSELLRATTVALEGDAKELRAEIRDAQADAARSDERADQAEEEARTKAEADLVDEVAALDARQAELDSRAGELTQREAAVAQAQEGLRATQFGDGVHEVGRDIQAGKYHRTGTGHCYYAKLGSDGEDIIANNIVEGPATVQVDSPYFESSGCGTWTKVG